MLIWIPIHSQNAAVSDLVAKRMLRVETNFEEIFEYYLSTRLPTVGGGDSLPSLSVLCNDVDLCL